MKTNLLLILLLACITSLAQPVNTLSAKEKKEGWKLLFDGKTGNGWIGAKTKTFPTSGWIIKDGLLTIQGADKNEPTVGDIITTEQYGAFELQFDFKLTPGANSGLKYFVTLETGSPLGLEYQLLDDDMHPDAKMGREGNRTLASLYDLIPANKPAKAIKPIGQWNTGRIIVHPDNRIEHYLNGVKLLEYVRKSPAYRDLVQQSKYKSIANFGEADKGHILLQDHGHEVSFRNVKIKTL